jgi:pyruvate,water dikinase
MVRRIFITIGQQLCREGHIDAPRDVFYLEIGEIQDGDTASYRALIAGRKAEYAEYEKLPGHARLVFRGDALVDGDAPAKWAGGFDGVGASGGKLTAEAVVLESPEEDADVRGKIIVARTTDPGWVFLLAMAGGIVAEKGSLLSHTAIVSRELMIPAVVAVESAASVIKTGDIVSLDGDTGRVEIVRAC